MNHEDIPLEPRSDDGAGPAHPEVPARSGEGRGRRRGSGGFLVLAAILILAASWYPYRHAGENGYVYDDTFIVRDNPRVQGLDRAWRIFTTEYWNKPYLASRLYRPIPLLTFAAENEIWGPSPAHLHRVNLWLHGLVSLLVAALAWVCLESFGRERKREPSRSQSGLRRIAPAALAGILFAVHPLHSEAVLGIVGRAELLAALFTLAALLSFGLGGRWRYAAPVFAVLALLSKESAVLLLPLVALQHLAGLTRPAQIRAGHDETATGSAASSETNQGAGPPGIWRSRLSALGHSLLLLAPAVAAAVALRLLALRDAPTPTIHFTDNPIVILVLRDRLATACVVFLEYLKLHLWPAVLSPDYSYDSVPLQSFRSPRALLGLGSLLAIGLGALALLLRARGESRISRRIGFALAWYLTGIVAVSHFIVPIGTFMGERLTYLPGIGLFLLVAFLLSGLLEDGGRLLARRLVAGGIVVLCAAAVGASIPVCEARTRAWHSNLTLFEQASRDQPRSFRVWNALGETQMRAGRFDDALVSLRRSAEIWPDFERTHDLFLSIYLDTGNLDSARVAATRLRELNPENVKAFYAFAKIDQAEGEPEKALEELRAGIEIGPDYLPFHLLAGEILEKQGRLDSAVDHYLKVIDGQPKLTNLRVRLGPLLLRTSRWPEAVAMYRDLYASDPSWGNANALSWSLLEEARHSPRGRGDEPPPGGTGGDRSTGERGGDRSLRKPGGDRGEAALAEAESLARRAVELAPKSEAHHALDTLAQVLWALDRPTEAIRTLEAAVDAAPQENAYRRRLKEYRNLLTPQGSTDH